MQRVRSTQKLPIAFRRASGKPADQRDRQCDASRGRDEIVDGQPGHLHEITHRRLGHVGLPVGVGDEAHRRVEGEAFFHRGLALRVEGQYRLQSLQCIERQEPGNAEKQHRHCICHPMLVLLFIDAAGPIDGAFDWPQDRVKGRSLAGKDTRHIAAERLRQQRDEQHKNRDLDPAVRSHRRMLPRTARGGSARKPDRPKGRA